MTIKLECPVCNHKLYQTASEPATYCCLYKDCQSDFKFAGSKELWTALIQAKQDLEIATKALKEVIEKAKVVVRGYEYIGTGIQRVARKALEQIEHKE